MLFIFDSVYRFSLSQQLRHLGLQLRLDLFDASVAHRLVLASVGLILRAIKRQMTNLDQPRLATKP